MLNIPIRHLLITLKIHQLGFTSSDPTMNIVTWILFVTFGCKIANGHGKDMLQNFNHINH